MKFRKLYWVTEQFGQDGLSEVAGVYTSIPDLIERGIEWRDGLSHQDGFRLTLVALDSRKKPLGTWATPEFGSLQSDLSEYVGTQEFGASEVDALVEALKGLQAKV